MKIHVQKISYGWRQVSNNLNPRTKAVHFGSKIPLYVAHVELGEHT